jgi:hypothetical protein
MSKPIESFGIEQLPVAGKKRADMSANSSHGVDNFADVLQKNLMRVKLWLWMQNNHPEEAGVLCDQKKMDTALGLMNKGDDSLGSRDEAWEEVKKSLGIRDSVKKSVQEMSLTEVVKTTLNDEASDKWSAELILVAKLEKSEKIDKAELDKIDGFLKTALKEYGPEGLREVTSGAGLEAVEDKIRHAMAIAEIKVMQAQKDVVGDKTALTKYGDVIGDSGEKRLLQPRVRKSKKRDQLEEEIETYTKFAELAMDQEKLGLATESDLREGFVSSNNLRQKVDQMVNRKVSGADKEKLYQMLTTSQRVYQDALLEKLIAKYEKAGRTWTSREVESGLEQVLREKKSRWSSKVEMPKLDELEVELERKMQTIRAKRKIPVAAGAASREQTSWEPSNEEFETEQRKARIEKEIADVMGPSQEGFNIFKDPHFFQDLARGDEGIEEIVKRAKPKDVVRFKDFLNKMRKSKEVGMLRERSAGEYFPGERLTGSRDNNAAWLSEINRLKEEKRFGEAASLMLEYITRIGIQESSQDWEFALIKRNFSDAIATASPDFKEAFDLNMQLGYLPNMNSQNLEKYYATAEQIFGKGKQELTTGETSLFSGNRVTTAEGKSVVFSMRTMKALLRNPRHMLRILKADPNTTDSTLQNIMLEELYGKGAHIGVRTVDGKKLSCLALPGVAEEDWKQLNEIEVGIQFAEIWAGGFNGWEKDGKKLKLSEMLQRNQWIMKNGLGLQWYSGEWKQLMAAKSYQDAVLQAAPKSLLTAEMAKAAYQGNFENIRPPLMRAAETITSVLGPMPIYKLDNIVIQNVQDKLEERAGVDRGKGKKIGEMIAAMYRQERVEDVGGEKLSFFSRLRDPRTSRLAFNTLSELDDGVVDVLVEKLDDMDIKKIPTREELKSYYTDFVALEAGSLSIINDPDGKRLGNIRYFGQMYKGTWQEVQELKMSSMKATWDSLGEKELTGLIEMNEGFTGELDSEGKIVDFDARFKRSGVVDVSLMKEYLLKNMWQEAMQDPTHTKHGDDWEQYFVKYSQARDKFLATFYKEFATIQGAKKHFIELDESLAQFLPPMQRRNITSLIGHDLNRATSYQSALAPLEIPLTTSRQHKHHWWEFGKSDHTMRGTSEIIWDKWTDSDGKAYYAYDKYGCRTYQKEQYVGNWAAKEQGDDSWRPHDFEDIGQKLQENGLLDERSKHLWLERVMSQKKEGRALVGMLGKRLGMSQEAIEKMGDAFGGLSTKGWLVLSKIFLFDDPKYALFSFMHEVSGLSSKTVESILGFDLMGGGKR